MKMDDLKNLDIQEVIDNLQNLDMENLGSWPMAVKAVIAGLIFAVAVVVGTILVVNPENKTLAQLESQEEELLKELENKAFRAHNIDQYRQQLKDMEKSFGTLLDQLPEDTEVPGLLEDITHTGLGSGLEFKQIELGDETEKEFYAELPIEIVVTGDYHGFGSFVSGVAQLPRIVTLHNFTVKPASENRDQGAPGLLEMQITAKTYRYATGEGGRGGDDKGKKGRGR